MSTQILVECVAHECSAHASTTELCRHVSFAWRSACKHWHWQCTCKPAQITIAAKRAAASDIANATYYGRFDAIAKPSAFAAAPNVNYSLSCESRVTFRVPISTCLAGVPDCIKACLHCCTQHLHIARFCERWASWRDIKCDKFRCCPVSTR